MATTNEEVKWYVVHTYSGYENKVASNLEKIIENRNFKELIQEIKIPMETVTEIKNNTEKEVQKKVFPGYILVKMVMNDETWYIVRNVRGCTGFIGSNATKPLPLSKEEVEKLGVEIKSVKLNYNVGEFVKIIDGPFENITGEVKEIDTKNKIVKVEVSMFGRKTLAELDLGQIQPTI